MQEEQSPIKRLFANKKLLLMIGGGILILIIGVSLISNIGDPKKDAMLGLVNRMESFTGFITAQNKSLNDSALRNQNANLTVVLSGNTSELSTLIKKRYPKDKVSKKIAATNATRVEEDTTSVEQAKLSNTYETTYRDLVTLELSALEKESARLAASSNGDTAKALKSASAQMKQARESFEKLKLTN